MKVNQKKYEVPTVKVVNFMVEQGFAGTNDRIVQPSSTEDDGMAEKLNDGSSLEWGWDWNTSNE